jgi:hypothetical protein
MLDCPAFGAGVQAWQDWVDVVAPLHGQPDRELPEQLRSLTRNPLRDVAAVAAENWYRTQERDRCRRSFSQPTQAELFEGIDDL